MNTVKLLFWAAIAYGVLLVLVRGVFPSESPPTISVTAIPLIVIIFIIARDLARKATSPTSTKTITTSAAFQGNPVQFLSDQLKVSTSASNSYFENVIRARLKELLTTKISLETGLEIDKVKRLLSDPREGQRLLEDSSLYRILYGPTPQRGLARMIMIGEAIDLIGAWKG